VREEEFAVVCVTANCAGVRCARQDLSKDLDQSSLPLALVTVYFDHGGSQGEEVDKISSSGFNGRNIMPKFTKRLIK
jgi:hypothetical protein